MMTLQNVLEFVVTTSKDINKLNKKVLYKLNDKKKNN